MYDINDGKHDFEDALIDRQRSTREPSQGAGRRNQFCSYCIIPYARGRVRSRRFENVIAEVERLAANGFNGGCADRYPSKLIRCGF